MNGIGPRTDLIALVPDADIEHGLLGVVSRVSSLHVRPFSCHVQRHPERDPGCLLRADESLRMFTLRYAHALVLFDREGCGRSDETREALEQEVENRLSQTGWKGRCAVIVIDPELDAWVWSDSPNVDRILGWDPATGVDLRAWLREQGLLGLQQDKPQRPKEALEAALRKVRRGRSPALYRRLAEKVSLDRCADAAFLKLKTTLQSWFAES